MNLYGNPECLIDVDLSCKFGQELTLRDLLCEWAHPGHSDECSLLGAGSKRFPNMIAASSLGSEANQHAESCSSLGEQSRSLKAFCE